MKKKLKIKFFISNEAVSNEYLKSKIEKKAKLSVF